MGPGNKQNPVLGLAYKGPLGSRTHSMVISQSLNRGSFVPGGPQRKVLRVKTTEISSILKDIKDAGKLVSITYLFNS